jgi:predicted transcriptional regulator
MSGMNTNEKYNMNEFPFDLLDKAMGEEGLDAVRLRDEIRKELEAGDKTLVKFLELVDSFQDVLPREKQRYNVATKALYTISGLSRQNVLESTYSQLEELKTLEKAVLSSLTGFRGELREMESRSKKIKSEIAELHEKIAELEKEEQKLLDNMAAREEEIKVIEDEVRKVFMDVGSEITGIRKKIEEFTGEKKASPRTATPPGPAESQKPVLETGIKETGVIKEDKGIIGNEGIIGDVNSINEDAGAVEDFTIAEDRGIIEDTSIIEGGYVPQESELEKTCSMCGGRMNFHIKESMWMCYSCGHEELENEVSERKGEF